MKVERTRLKGLILGALNAQAAKVHCYGGLTTRSVLFHVEEQLQPHESCSEGQVRSACASLETEDLIWSSGSSRRIYWQVPTGEQRAKRAEREAGFEELRSFEQRFMAFGADSLDSRADGIWLSRESARKILEALESMASQEVSDGCTCGASAPCPLHPEPAPKKEDGEGKGFLWNILIVRPDATTVSDQAFGVLQAAEATAAAMARKRFYGVAEGSRIFLSHGEGRYDFSLEQILRRNPEPAAAGKAV